MNEFLETIKCPSCYQLLRINSNSSKFSAKERLQYVLYKQYQINIAIYSMKRFFQTSQYFLMMSIIFSRLRNEKPTQPGIKNWTEISRRNLTIFMFYKNYRITGLDSIQLFFLNNNIFRTGVFLLHRSFCWLQIRLSS